MNVFEIIVNFNDGQKDYVSATVYHNDMYWGALEDIAKPENVHDYDMKWRNGLVYHYHGVLKNKLPHGANIIAH